jgi:hypothetical protein
VKVHLMHPSAYTFVLNDIRRYVPTADNRDSLVLLSRYAPPDQVYTFDHDSQELIDWLADFVASIEALER